MPETDEPPELDKPHGLQSHDERDVWGCEVEIQNLLDWWPYWRTREVSLDCSDGVRTDRRRTKPGLRTTGGNGRGSDEEGTEEILPGKDVDGEDAEELVGSELVLRARTARAREARPAASSNFCADGRDEVI